MTEHCMNFACTCSEVISRIYELYELCRNGRYIVLE